MNYRSAISEFSRYIARNMTRLSKRATLKCATTLLGLSLMSASSLLAETPTRHFLINQATVSYTTSEQAFVSRSNESVVPIVSQAELAREIALRSLKFNSLSPEIFSLLMLEAKPQRFLINQATVSYEKSDKSIVASSNESIVAISLPAEIKLISRNSSSLEGQLKSVRPSL